MVSFTDRSLIALKSLSRILSPTAFETLQGLLYRGENVDGIRNRFWRTGEVMTTQVSPHTPRHLQEGRTGRVPLHKILLEEIPEGTIIYGKKVLRVEKLELARKGSGGVAEVQLHFADGDTETSDLVVVADGLYSVGLAMISYGYERLKSRFVNLHDVQVEER
jgi:6-hydroxynicotinate 3-monooxygenase